MSIEAPSTADQPVIPEPIPSSIPASIPAAGEFSEKSKRDLWDQLRELARAGESIHVSAARIAG